MFSLDVNVEQLVSLREAQRLYRLSDEVSSSKYLVTTWLSAAGL